MVTVWDWVSEPKSKAISIKVTEIAKNYNVFLIIPIPKSIIIDKKYTKYIIYVVVALLRKK